MANIWRAGSLVKRGFGVHVHMRDSRCVRYAWRVMIESITIEPALTQWASLARGQPTGEMLGKSLREWRDITRAELDLPRDRPIIATGHQPMFWHPGILAKYLAVDAMTRGDGGTGEFAAMHVVVDQDVVDASSFEIPIRREDGALAARRIELAPNGAHDDVPALMQPPSASTAEIDFASIDALDSVRDGARMIASAMRESSSASNLAQQVAEALRALLRECADIHLPQPLFASNLMTTSLARTMLQAMLDDPHRCARAYNEAIATEPRARLTPLSIRDDYVELPFWRVREDGTRMRGYDSDIELFLASSAEFSQSKIQNPKSKIGSLLPRALFMTAILRLAACDLFVHGLGGAAYDRAMERWMRAWFGTCVSPMAVVSATVRLPLMDDEDLLNASPERVQVARAQRRRVWHDPLVDFHINANERRPSAAKRTLIESIDREKAASIARRKAYAAMHGQLQAWRVERADAIQSAELGVDRLEKLQRDAVIASRRDWPFPLYSREVLRELRERM